MSLAILLATYNGERFLAEQLDSLFFQSYSDFVIYAHDDGSTDRTVEILHQYEKKYPEKLVILEYEPTGGAKNNFYSLMQRVDADYYMFCDQDDVWRPEKIEETFKKIIELEKDNPQLPYLVFTDLTVTDEKLNILYDSLMRKFDYQPDEQSICTVLSGNIAFGCSMLFNKLSRNCALNIQDINDFSMHDTLMMLVVLSSGRVGYLSYPTIYYRQHQNNDVGLKDKDFNYWVRNKLENIVHGRQLKESKRKITSQKAMISELGLMANVLPEEQLVIQELKGVLHGNKLCRMKIYYKYGLLNNSWKNRWKIILV